MISAAAPHNWGVSCVFCQIIDGAIPAWRVLDDDAIVAFLDTRPVFKGHTLVVPRMHVDTFTDIGLDEMAPVTAAAQALAKVMVSALGAQGSFVAMNNTVSQSVPHLHVHVVPRTKKDGLRGFFWPRTRYADDEEANGYAERLRAGLTRLTA